MRRGAIVLALMAAEAAFAKSYILVAGRRDPRIYAIDFEAALRPENKFIREWLGRHAPDTSYLIAPA